MSTNVKSDCVRPNLAESDPVLGELGRKLQSSTFVSIRNLSCESNDGVVILRGCVPTFYIRQVALALVMNVPGVLHVDDHIVVDGLAARQLQ